MVTPPSWHAAAVRCTGCCGASEARDCTALDLYEAVAEGLYGRSSIRVGFSERTLKAMTYVAARSLEGRPRPLYQEAVVRAADEWGLPPAYVQELATWLPLPSRLARQARPSERPGG